MLSWVASVEFQLRVEESPLLMVAGLACNVTVGDDGAGFSAGSGGGGATVSPATINKGDSSTLSWNSTDATQLSIAPDVGAVTAQGSTKVAPSDTTTYTVT